MQTAIQALAEPRRREILALIRDRELTAGAIASGFDVTRPAISQHLGVLKEAASNMRRAAVLFGSDSVATVAMLHAAEAVAPSLDVQVTAVDVSGGDDIERGIATFASQPDGGLIVTPHSNVPANRGS